MTDTRTLAPPPRRPMSPERAARITQQGYQAHRRGDFVAALRCYQAVLAARPDFPDALHHAALAARQLAQHARAQGKSGGLEESTRLMLRAIEVATALAHGALQANPDAYLAERGALAPIRRLYAAMLHNYAWFQHDRGVLEGPDGARALYEAALGQDPRLGEAWVNLGNVLGELGLRLRSEACWHRALELPTPSPEATYNLAFVKLARGDFLTGWRDYEARWQSPVFLASYGRPDVTGPRWDGRRLDGTLYLHGEQGAGDMLMMARYVELVATGVRRLVVEVPDALTRLFAETFPDVTIARRGDPAPPHDAELPMMSLPATLGTLLETIPAPAPFARAAPLAPEPTRVGLCWKGSPTHPNDRARSLPFDAVRPLLEVPGVVWQSLQWNDATPGLDPLGSGDFLETARAIARCALVITVDTSVAHLAGSLGVPTWLLLPPHAEWRWLRDRPDTPWYPSVRLYRARRPEWGWLVGQVAEELTAWREGR